MVEEPEFDLLPEVGFEAEPATGVETLRLDPGAFEEVADEVFEVWPGERDSTPTQFG